MSNIMFYGHNDKNYILSNFYPHVPGKKLNSLNIMYEGLSYPTSEHLYQALKFKNETADEKKWREYIRTAKTPNIAKYLGNMNEYCQYGWQQPLRKIVIKYKNKVRLAGDITDIGPNNFRIKIMKIAVCCKYESVKEFREFLSTTKGKYLCEQTMTNWGMSGNWLGLILMEIRDKNN